MKNLYYRKLGEPDPTSLKSSCRKFEAIRLRVLLVQNTLLTFVAKLQMTQPLKIIIHGNQGV